MMFKRHVTDKLSIYLDNQLSDKQREKIDMHLKECKQCSEELERLKLVSRELKAWQAPDLEAGFERSVKDAIVQWELQRGRPKMKKNWRMQLVPVTSLVVVVCFALLITQVFVKRGFRGGLKDSADKLGEKFGKPKYALNQKSQGLDYASVNRFSLGGLYGKTNGVAGDRKIIAKGGRWDDYDGITHHYGAYGAANDPPMEGRGFPAKNNIYVVNRGVDSFEGLDESGVSRRGEFGTGSEIGRLARVDTEAVSNGSVIVVQPILPATGEGEMVIRTGNVRIEVEDGQKTYQEASAICQELGGYIADSRFYKDKESRESGHITMRIPKDKFNIALDKFSQLGKLEGIDTSSQDVSQQYSNLKSRLDTTMIVYNKMLDALKKRKVEPSEAVRLESELTPIARRIENLKNQIEYLNNSVSFTTITLNFYEPKISAKILKESRREIKERMLSASINAIKFAAAAIPVVIILGFWIVVIVLASLAIKRWISRLTKRD